MKRESKVPAQIRNMVATARQRGLNSAQIALRINGSKTALKLGYVCDKLQVAGIMAGLARRSK
jgi:hypothetical protein